MAVSAPFYYLIEVLPVQLSSFFRKFLYTMNVGRVIWTRFLGQIEGALPRKLVPFWKAPAGEYIRMMMCINAMFTMAFDRTIVLRSTKVIVSDFKQHMCIFL